MATLQNDAREPCIATQPSKKCRSSQGRDRRRLKIAYRNRRISAERMNNLRTTYRTTGKQITLGYSNADLAEMMHTHFSREIGVFDNHTVAHGMDTSAWVTRQRQEVLEAARQQSEDFASSSLPLRNDFQDLHGFLTSVNDENLEIRHHYAWWYPKWVDTLRAAW